MKELFMLLAATLPIEDILQRMSDALGDYIINPSEENQVALDMTTHMYLVHRASKGTPEGAKEIIKRMDESERRDKLFEVGEN